MSQISNTPGVIRLFGCGGAGINIIGSWDATDGDILPGGGLCKIVYVDTSKSNLPEGADPSKLYLLEGVDGSGKVRAENHVEIGKNIRNVLQKHEVGDMNIVCFSASGGSGSVFGPLLIGELIERGAPVIGVVIGSEESNITCKNTLNTLKSLEAIARKKQVPVVIFYQHNSATNRRSDVDVQCRYALATLSLLGNRCNRELDTKDVANWLNYSKVTSVEPQLSLLHVYRDPTLVDQASQPISIASLRSDPDQPTYTAIPEYYCAGYPRDAVKEFDQLHFVITVDGIGTIHQMINSKLEEAAKSSAARVKRDSIVGNNDAMTDDGLVL